MGVQVHRSETPSLGVPRAPSVHAPMHQAGALSKVHLLGAPGKKHRKLVSKRTNLLEVAK